MSSDQLDPVEWLKISCFSSGVRLSDRAVALLAGGSGDRSKLTLHEYATTGGVTLEVGDGVLVNAPFDGWYEGRGTWLLDVSESGRFVLSDGDDTFPVQRILPLPGYLDAVIDVAGTPVPVTDVAMSHADRVRVSPILGCAYNCRYCDLAELPYRKRPLEQIVRSLRVALADETLTARHVLISGGSPRRTDYEYFETLCVALTAEVAVDVDIMMSPMIENVEVIDRLVEAGIHGFALNIEVYREVIEGRDGPHLLVKSRLTGKWFEQTLERAVELTGGRGRVRSLIIPGLEPLESTLAGVEFLAERGCDPVLSPFRPAPGIPLESRPPPSPEELAELLVASREIVNRHGVTLGPRCVPCQHNTLTFPGDVASVEYVPMAATTSEW